jgi:hypothetical protein
LRQPFGHRGSTVAVRGYFQTKVTIPATPIRPLTPDTIDRKQPNACPSPVVKSPDDDSRNDPMASAPVTRQSITQMAVTIDMNAVVISSPQ